MGEWDPQRRVAQYRLDRLAEEDGPADDPPRPDDDLPPGTDAAGAGDGSPAGSRSAERPSGPRPTSWAARGAFADELVRQAMLRGEFDDLPLAGKPIPGLTGRHDPDWWLKSFIEREGLTGVLPEALQLRKDDAALDAVLDREHGEHGVREALAEFNARVVEARRQLRGGPPVVTPLRDVEAEVLAWHERRRARAAAVAAQATQRAADADRAEAERRARRWWRRRGDGAGPPAR
ncbi:DUF1992 domain-containing protein [Cellulomonas sp. ATA003]|uniref:DnaJ family domain-containing protein n=1 Tax=Cellulomonas sp. ATA003 TaxID=3073064 RepID=UPI0028735357|nr:DUF1992 domain-containing protein [Cellulomonas sp. ATA003]WNB84557.1 DUF1992 domain-containing protein [Cellulomonas sp. ATA003]